MGEEEINIDELNPQQKAAILMADLPVPVQNFLRSPERDAVSIELSTKYKLHADQAGVFSDAYIYMLMGIYTPEEFVQQLRQAQIPEATVQGITLDLNERVFKRLQNAERTYTPPATPAPAPKPVPPPVVVAPVTPKPIQPTVMSAPIVPKPVQPPVVAAPVLPKPAVTAPAPLVASIPTFNPALGPVPTEPTPTPTPFAPVPKSMPVIPVQGPMPAAAPVPPPVPQIPAYIPPSPGATPIYSPPTEAVQPGVRTMAHDIEMIKEAVEHPHPVRPDVPPQISWQPNSPARSFQTSSVPNTLAAPSIHPAPTGVPIAPIPSMPPAPTMPAPSAPLSVAVPPQHTASTPPLPPSSAPVPHNLPTEPAAYPWQQQTPASVSTGPANPIIKEYSVDPYREVPQ
ncbi:MAG: Proline-rich protein [Parcubacteria bacterium C7867-008]|nr:MAG: Proline-rich protein [Parcubacteria bacterium C7867-008]